MTSLDQKLDFTADLAVAIEDTYGERHQLTTKINDLYDRMYDGDVSVWSEVVELDRELGLDLDNLQFNPRGED